MIHTHICSHAY